MAEVLVAAMAASPVEQLVVRPASRVRSEIAARKAAGISDHEATVGALDLQGNGFVLFTDRALYWTNQGQAAAVGYRQFPGRQFALSAPTHVDLGDGVPRLIGPRAPALVALLTAIQHRLSTDA
jgi:hypothetical protein